MKRKRSEDAVVLGMATRKWRKAQEFEKQDACVATLAAEPGHGDRVLTNLEMRQDRAHPHYTPGARCAHRWRAKMVAIAMTKAALGRRTAARSIEDAKKRVERKAVSSIPTAGGIWNVTRAIRDQFSKLAKKFTGRKS